MAGANNPVTGLPRTALLFPRAVDASTGREQTQFGRFDSSGALGPGYAPFVPGAGGDLQQDMQINLAVNRLADRRALLSELDRLKIRRDSGGPGSSVEKPREQAFTTVLNGAAQAFDLSREDPRTVERYDTAPLVRPEEINPDWKNYPHYVDNAKSLGKLLLLARRLCEAGCGFVTVTTNFVWDMHADVNNAPCGRDGYNGPPLDHAVSVLVEDLAERGLTDRILLVCCGEMGRSPRVNVGGGRDHWGNLAPLLLAGGGLRMGQVIGQSSRDGGQPQSNPVRIPHLIATVMQSLIDPGELRVLRGMPSDLVQAVVPSRYPVLGSTGLYGSFEQQRGGASTEESPAGGLRSSRNTLLAPQPKVWRAFCGFAGTLVRGQLQGRCLTTHSRPQITPAPRGAQHITKVASARHHCEGRSGKQYWRIRSHAPALTTNVLANDHGSIPRRRRRIARDRRPARA